MEKAKGKDYIKNWVAVIGDSTFMHTGVNSLMNMVYNQGTGTVMILDNSTTGMTGHQQNPTTGYNLKGDPAAKVDLEALCKAIGINSVRVVDPYNIAECETVIKEELAKEFVQSLFILLIIKSAIYHKERSVAKGYTIAHSQFQLHLGYSRSYRTVL